MTLGYQWKNTSYFNIKIDDVNIIHIITKINKMVQGYIEYMTHDVQQTISYLYGWSNITNGYDACKKQITSKYVNRWTGKKGILLSEPIGIHNKW